MNSVIVCWGEIYNEVISVFEPSLSGCSSDEFIDIEVLFFDVKADVTIDASEGTDPAINGGNDIRIVDMACAGFKLACKDFVERSVILNGLNGFVHIDVCEGDESFIDVRLEFRGKMDI
jgi:hypothetical protein